MIDWRKDTWFYALIAGILAIISIFTPVGSDPLFLGPWIYSWLGGFINYAGDPYNEFYGTGAANLYLFGATAISATLLFVYSINTWRGKEFKEDWLIYLLTGLAMLIFTILYWVYEADQYERIGFASIGIFISSILAIIGFALTINYRFYGRDRPSTP